MVTQDGETILQGYDDWAKKFLIRNKLTWTSWGRDQTINTPDFQTVFKHFGYRRILTNNDDGKQLRLFFLSLLWRVAATDMPEFKVVRLLPEELETLGLMVLKGETEPLEFFPIQLIQLSTRNWPHNFSAEIITKVEPLLDPATGQLVSNPPPKNAYRLFFDGLVVHFVIDADKRYVMERAQLTVGATDELVVATVESDESRQIKKFLYETGMPALTSIEIAEEWEELVGTDSDKEAWAALSKIVAPSSIQEKDGQIEINLDYRKYMDYFPVLRKEALDGAGKERFLLLSWRVTKKLGESVNWRTLNDARFPKTVLDYTFSEGYITMSEGPLKLMGWRPPAEDLAPTSRNARCTSPLGRFR
ncbi:MAG: hypothetical protein JO312_00070 [Hyphomicrobiales bacterium]|nr:hypothetical protein [Hyphomicrobiales bacterium]